MKRLPLAVLSPRLYRIGGSARSTSAAVAELTLYPMWLSALRSSLKSRKLDLLES